MKIDLHNYGAYIVDYFEGNLSAQEREDLMVFLNANPACKKEFEEFDNSRLNDLNEGLVFSEKEALKKRTMLSDEELFDLSEGNLSGKEKTEAEKIIFGNAQLERELLLWKKSKLQPGLSIVFPGKEKLKRRPVVVALWQNIYLRAAAVIAIVLGAGWIYFANGGSSGKEMLAVSGAADVKMQVAFKTKNNFKDPSENFSGQNDPENNTDRKNANDNKSRRNDNNNSFASSNNKINGQKNPLENNKINNPDTGKVVIARQDTVNRNNLSIKNDTVPEEALVKNTADSLIKKELHGTWEPEEIIPVTQKGLKQKFLDVAVTCLRGLKKIGVKKADGVKKPDPVNGNTEYTLVLGKRSYSVNR